MTTDASAVDDATIQQKWEETVAAGHGVDKTISANLEITRRIVKNSLADGIRRLGYEFGVELGRGGLGIVNLATQQVFDRPVAVKRLLGGNTNREAAMKFFAEALVTAQLEHPNIVPIHDLMADADGQLQLAMKRVAGLSWRDLLHPRKDEHRTQAALLDLDDHLDILLKVCDAISFAHGRGILHRDLKPENVMVGDYGEVLVMDWGCAVAFGEHEQHPVVPRVEEITHIAGTPSYMAPEMVLVRADRIGPHSDVYQLGAVLYEVLTGQKAHRGGNVYDVLRDAAKGTVVPPTQAAPDRGIPEELSDLCLSALTKDPAARIPQVGVLAQRIKDYRRHAQAVALEAAARAHLAAAAKNRRGADEALRKAVSAAEQAREIWPGWNAAALTLLNATLAWAQLHLDAGAPALAVTQCDQAATLARELSRGDLVKAASGLGAKARAAVTALAARQRQLRVARYGMAAAGLLLVIGLAAFLTLVSAEKNRTAVALAKAEQALAALTHEQVARGDDQKTSVPALIVQARKAMGGKDWDGALKALQTAIGFDPKLVEAHQLYVNVLVAAKRYGDVLTAGPQWQDAAGGDSTATQLIALCRVMTANPSPVVATEAQVKIADLFERQQLYILAETMGISPAKRLALYRKRIDEAWPGVSPAIKMRDDGKLVTDIYEPKSKGFINRKNVIDLEPIRGMPFALLNLGGSGVRKLDALVGMPLEVLSIQGTAVIDLSPLRGVALKDLTLVDTKITDLSPLAGMPLRRLWGYNAPIKDLTPLRGMPLEDVQLLGCKIEDLSGLAGAPITFLYIGDGVRDLTPLRGLPIKELTVFGQGDLDLSPLSSSPLEKLSISTDGSLALAGLPDSIKELLLSSGALRRPTDLGRVRPVVLKIYAYRGERTIDLSHCDGSRLESLEIVTCDRFDVSGLSAPRLQRISLSNVGTLDLSPLAKFPVREIELRGAPSVVTWKSLAAFRQSTTLTTVALTDRKIPVAVFWPSYDPLIPPGSVVSKPTVLAGLFKSVAVDVKPGLVCERFSGIERTVENIIGKKSDEQSVRSSLGIVDAPNMAGWRFTGYLIIARAGDYTLSLSSDDGSRLLLHGQPAIDVDGDHAMQTGACQVHLDVGAHPLTVLYYNGANTGGLSVDISGPDLPLQPIPANMLGH